MKKALSFLLCIVLIVTMLQTVCCSIFIGASAETPTSVWDGSITKPAGTGAESTPYLITNGSELAWYIKFAEDWKNTRFAKLTDDIYLNDITKINWETGESENGYTPNEWFQYTSSSDKTIGDKFLGNLNGDGHAVYGLYFNKPESVASIGLIPIQANDYSITVKNLGIDKSYIASNGKSSAIFGCAEGVDKIIENCYVGKDVTIIGKCAGVALGSGQKITINKFYSLAKTTGSTYYGVIADSWGTKSLSNAFAVGTAITSKTSNTIPCTNVYADNTLGASGAEMRTADNMQGLDALTSNTKMSGLAECGAFVATEGYPILKSFEKEVEEEETVRPQIAYLGEDYIYGEVKLSTDFEECSEGTLPFGWESGYNGAGTSFGWTGTNPSITAQVVNDSANGKVLNFASTNNDAFVAMPEINSDNYVYETTVIVNHNSNNTSSFGLTNGMYGGLSNADGTMFLSIYTNKAGLLPYYYYRGSGGSSQTAFELPGNVSLPVSGETVKLKLVRFGEKSYLYYNGVYTVTIPNRVGGSGNDCLGFFISGADILITDVKVQEIIALDDISSENEIVDSQEYDFSKAEQFDLSLFKKSQNATANIVNDATIGKALEFSSSTEGFLTLPKIHSRDYVFEANVVIAHDSDKDTPVGICFNMWNSSGVNEGGANNADGGYYTSIYTNQSKELQNFTDISSNTVTSYKPSQNITVPSTGDMLNIKIISFNGYSYIYYNGIFATVIEQRDGDSNNDFVGFYTADSKLLITDVKVDTYIPHYYGFNEVNAQISYADIIGSTSNANGVKFNAYFDITDEKYSSDAEFGFIVKLYDEIDENGFTVSDKSAFALPTEKTPTIKNGVLNYSVEIIGLSDEIKDKFFNARAYMAVNVDGEKVYYYSPIKIVSPSSFANALFFDNNSSENIKIALEEIYGKTIKFRGNKMQSLNITLFSDLHYKEGMYIASVEDLNGILKRANDNNSDFVLSSGDFCNDYTGSPELINAFINNSYGLKVYNVYGNHELETNGNTMNNVTPNLTNDNNVIWGTKDGKIGDGSIAYYYFDKNGFRFINLDTNYSLNPTTNEWEHNLPASYGAPAGNKMTSCLGPVQTNWLEETLFDAAENGLRCIVNSHVSYSSAWTCAPNAAEVRAIYSKVNGICPGTVMMSINGDLHSNHSAVIGNILYLDINTVRNGWWQSPGYDHYGTDDTFRKVSYDSNGNVTTVNENYYLKDLSGGKTSWFFADPLSAVLKINTNGVISLEGKKSTWYNGVIPTVHDESYTPEISSGTWKLNFMN